MDELIKALNSIDPSRLDYDEWLSVGIALKAEGYPCSVWDSWSSSDPRYRQGDCYNRWDGFNADTVSAKTIYYLAKEHGNYSGFQTFSRDDGLDAYYETVLNAQRPVEEEQPYQMAVRYLKAVFKPEEMVSFVTSAEYVEDKQKWCPANSGPLRKCEDIIKALEDQKSLTAGFGTLNEASGAWIRHNPTKGPNDKDVTDFRHVLVESDSLSLEEQKKILIETRLPITALIESGGKSIHAIIKIQAKDSHEFDSRVNFLYEYMSNKGFIIDNSNRNPARLSRLPGAMRGDKRQRLLGINIGCSGWFEWKDYIDGIVDDLPQLDNLYDMMQEEDVVEDEVVASILFQGSKMIITGDSKSGKTCLSQNLACCIAEGKPWLGKYQCKQGRVLYLNLEIKKNMLKSRFKAIYKANGWELGKNLSNIRPWNLRGKALPLDKLAPAVIRRVRNEGPFVAIIIDPVYKVQQGDENSAEAISKFCCALDLIAEETGAAVIYDHHHPKGMSGERKAIDRGAGSGVFARDADALIDISNLELGNDASDVVKELANSGERPMEMSFVLRDFPDQPTQKVWFRFPLHTLDKANLLHNCYVEGSSQANFSKNPNRKSDDEKHRIVDESFEAVAVDGHARLTEMESVAEVNLKTLRKYVTDTPGYKVEKGFVFRTNNSTDK